MTDKGILYMVATPIGNLEDITLRAIRVLKEVDLIAAEDTRQTLKLLNHLGISKPLTSYFRHNETRKGQYIINKLLEGQSIALVSDAGTPGISDPGEELVQQAIQNDIKISPIPGASAAISGLIVSGLPTGRFVFEGFLPMNKRARREKLENLRKEERTIIFYEAPHKLVYSLRNILEILGDRNIVLARELTKMYEEVIRTTVSEAIEKYRERAPKGEFVLLVQGQEKGEEPGETGIEWEGLTVEDHVKAFINLGMSRKDAIKQAASDRNINKRELYKMLIKSNKP